MTFGQKLKTLQYVSRETIDGFLSYRRQRAGRIALGVGLLIAAGLSLHAETTLLKSRSAGDLPGV